MKPSSTQVTVLIVTALATGLISSARAAVATEQLLESPEFWQQTPDAFMAARKYTRALDRFQMIKGAVQTTRDGHVRTKFWHGISRSCLVGRRKGFACALFVVFVPVMEELVVPVFAHPVPAEFGVPLPGVEP